MRILYAFFLFVISFAIHAQANLEQITELKMDQIAPNTKKMYWLKMVDNGLSQPVYIPVIVLKGTQQSPVLGLIAAIHGNELNGIRVIQEIVDDIDLSTLNGTIIAVPGLNAVGIPLHQRHYFDGVDLNRKFPGKENGNRSQQFVWHINTKLLPKMEYLVDMHTASFGRENSLYVRAALKDEAINKMAKLQDADIILNSDGMPSTNDVSSVTRTLRAEAMQKGIPTITVEYGNPQVFQPELIERGKRGIKNLMGWLKMTEAPIVPTDAPVLCKKSYWIYVEEGGYLEIKVDLKQKLKKGELIAVMRNPFGEVLKEYLCPEDGIVIGKSSNPVNMSGGRIIHLGIYDE